jgi:hypothetical protein
MMQNDPNRRRYTGVMDLATRLGNPGRVYFGGQVFSGERTLRFSNPRFIDDVALFNGQVAATSAAGAGQTPYLGALNLALSELTADVNESGAMSKRTRYVIIFLSDGQPTDSAEPQILAAVDQLMALKAQVGGITLNTVFLGGDPTAITLMQNMATRGEGQFKSFPNGDALDYTGFDFSAIRRTFLHRFFMATNVSMVSDGKVQLVDSDGDSLPDVEEQRIGSDPVLRDTDQDGCNDALEARVGWDPRARAAGQCTCTAAEIGADPDRDGLTTCEEKWVGTVSIDPDSDIAKVMGTDGDLVPDGLDFYSMQDATFPNVSTDRDLDGRLDIEELRVHTAIDQADTDRDRWAYRYAKFERATDGRCYDFEIDNVTLGRTLATADHGSGENMIELHFAQSSQDDPHHDRIYRVARLRVPYAEGNAVIRVAPSDFSTILGGP